MPKAEIGPTLHPNQSERLTVKHFFLVIPQNRGPTPSNT
jgi:hypothetical protein